MANVLIIDDLRNPILSKFPDTSNISIARTSQEAIAFFQNTTFETVFWDHDLGGDDTTRNVIQFLVEEALADRRIKIYQNIVHSANNIGADWIVGTLQSRFLEYHAQKVDSSQFFTA